MLFGRKGVELSKPANNRLLISLVLSVGFYLFLIIPKIARPVAGWEICTWEVARSIVDNGPAAVKFFYLPPLYASLIAISFKLFGISEISARIPGVACFIAVSFIICLLIKEISVNKKDYFPAALIALSIFVSSPAAVQGSLVIDHPDTTLFMLLAGLFYLFLFKTERSAFGARVFWLGIIYALCLWAKMTTALSFLIALPLAFILAGERKKAVKLSLGVFLWGIALFLLSWFSYCYFISGARRFIEPFSYYAMNTADSFFVGFIEKIARIILDIFRISVWFSPFLLILGIAAIFDILKNARREENKKIIHPAVFISIVIIGYLSANATFSSFPKYVVPALPMLACVIACYSERLFRGAVNQKEFFVLILFLIGGMLYYFFFTGDLIYEIFLIRQARLLGAVEAYLYGIPAKSVLYFGFPLALVFVSKKFLSVSLNKRIILGIFTALIAGNIAVSLAQRKADYSLNYAYGAQGLEQLNKFLKRKAPLEVFTTTEGVIANIEGVSFSGASVGAWDSPRTFLDFMDKRRPRAFLYGLSTNNIGQFKRILYSHEVKDYFKKYYREYAFGSYSMLIRNARDD